MQKKHLTISFFLLLFLLVFSSTFYAQVGIGTVSPTTTLDVNGAISLREGNELILASGTNIDVSLGTQPYSIYRITGPTGNFAIGSIVPVSRSDGQLLTLENTTDHTLTMLHNTRLGGVNNIYCPGERDITLLGRYATIMLQYNASLSRWIVLNYADNRYGDNIQNAVGTTDISTTSTSPVDMDQMSITFTPNHETIYVTFSAAGHMPGFEQPNQVYSEFRLVNVTAGNTVLAGTNTLVTDEDDDIVGTAWDAQIAMFPVTVIPGTPVTLKMQWLRSGPDLGTDTLLNNVASSPDFSHRSLTIFD